MNSRRYSDHRPDTLGLDAISEVPLGSNVGEVMLLKQAYTLLEQLLQDSEVSPKLASGLQAVSSLLRAQCSLTRSAQELRHRSDTGIFRVGGDQRDPERPRRRPVRTMSKKETKAELLDDIEISDDDLPIISAKYACNNDLLHSAMLLRIKRNMNLGTWTTTTTATGLPSLESAPIQKRSSSLIAKQWARGSTEHCRALKNLIAFSSRKQSSGCDGARSSSCSPASREVSPSSPELFHNSCLSRKSSCQSVNRLSVSSVPNSENSVPASPSGQTPSGSTPSASLLAIPHSNNGSLFNVAAGVQSGTPSPTESPRQRSTSTISKAGNTSPTMQVLSHVRHASQSGASRPHNVLVSRKAISPKRVAELTGQRRGTPESTSGESDSCCRGTSVSVSQPLSPVVAFSLKDIHHHALLSNHELKKWDYPLFDAERELGDFLLSKLALKVFHDVGLLQCFKVPIDRFIAYFHAIESTYGSNAYHNKLHAADVLHSCSYLTTQPVPGLRMAGQNQRQTSCENHVSKVGKMGPVSEAVGVGNSPTNRQGFCNFRIDTDSLVSAAAAAAAVTNLQEGQTEPQCTLAGPGVTNGTTITTTVTSTNGTEPFHLRNPLHKVNSDAYGVIGSNLIALELLALFSAAILHDYDHPGRTNAYLVATQHPLAILYNDRSVLENHHAAHAWQLLMSRKEYNWLCDLDSAELKRFRFLFIEIILATDLKRHFEFLTEWTSRFCPDQGDSGIDWLNETDRLLVLQMLVKMADINGPTKVKDIHLNWVHRITEEFYLQGDDEAKNGLPISPYMNRKDPQLAKLQVTFINHVVSPLCSALYCAQILPGYWSMNKKRPKSSSSETDDSAVASDSPVMQSRPKKDDREILCVLMENLRNNQSMWTDLLADEEKWAAASSTTRPSSNSIQNNDGSNGKNNRNAVAIATTANALASAARDKLNDSGCLTESNEPATNGSGGTFTMRERSKTFSMPSVGHSRLVLGLQGWRGPGTAANQGQASQTSTAESTAMHAKASYSAIRAMAMKPGAMQKFLLAQQQEKQGHHHRRQHRRTLGGALPFNHKLKTCNETNDADDVKTLVVPNTVNTKLSDQRQHQQHKQTHTQAIDIPRSAKTTNL